MEPDGGRSVYDFTVDTGGCGTQLAHGRWSYTTYTLNHVLPHHNSTQIYIVLMSIFILTLYVSFREGEISSAENIIIVQMDPLVQVGQVSSDAPTDRIAGDLGQRPEDQLPVGGHL